MLYLSACAHLNTETPPKYQIWTNTAAESHSSTLLWTKITNEKNKYKNITEEVRSCGCLVEAISKVCHTTDLQTYILSALLMSYAVL